jgi:Spy/CpxP family protein refolding chaperone
MTRRYVGIGCTVLGLLAAPAVVSAGERSSGAPIVPIVHEEMGRSIGELMDQLQDLGTQLRERFAGRDLPAERPLISIMLSHRAELGLSAAQVEALERLRAEFQKEAIRVEADVRIAETDLRLLLAADPVDLSRVEAKIREIEKRRADLRVARIRAIEQARSQLTPDQRDKLRVLLAGGRPAGSGTTPAPAPAPGAPSRL